MQLLEKRRDIENQHLDIPSTVGRDSVFQIGLRSVRKPFAKPIDRAVASGQGTEENVRLFSDDPTHPSPEVLPAIGQIPNVIESKECFVI